MEKFLHTNANNHHAHLDDETYGARWLSALETLARNSQSQILDPTLQQEIIYMAHFMRIMPDEDQNRFLQYCEKLLPMDCILEMLDKNPVLQYNYRGESGPIRSYINIML
jgi:hypothetical protein